MRYVLVYTKGNVPADKREEVSRRWQDWQMMKYSKMGFEMYNGRVISSNGIGKSDLDFVGLDIIEVESSEQALEIAKGCPGIPYGMSVQLWEELVE